MHRTEAELLSPAGSLATLKAVACAGADAVYGAGERFGARAYAPNMTTEELLEAIDYLHIHGKRFYLTVNTLLKEQELLGSLHDYILPLYRQGLDAVIVQDLGVLSFLRQQFPGLGLHASTQMFLTGPEGAKLMKELGCSRIIPARELSLAELAQIHSQADMELECFVHGALCYCYSGQCLLSSMIGGRSGNRGRCAQPCRLPYRLPHGKMREAHLLSPRDLCALELLPQILDSGVYSLKIEGRMKQLEYAAGVTSIYREYLDRCMENPKGTYRVAEADLRRLIELGSRGGYTRGYYEMRNGPQMMAMERSAHTSGEPSLQAEVREQFGDGILQEKIKGNLTISQGFPAKLVVEWKHRVRVTAEGELPQGAKKQPLSKEAVAERLQKTGGSDFVFDEIEVNLGEGLFLPMGALNYLRRDALAQLKEKLCQRFRREAPASTGGEHAQAEETPASAAPYLAIAAQTGEQAKFLLKGPCGDRIYLAEDAFEAEGPWADFAGEAHDAGKKLYCALPAVVRGDSAARIRRLAPRLLAAGVDGFVTGSLEGLGLLRELGAGPENVVADSGLYAWNGQSAQALRQMGAGEVTLPVELNRQELRRRGYAGGELLVYGFLPLMVSAQCPRKNTSGCTGQGGFMELTDRYGKHFPVKLQCTDCYSVAYNSVPLSLLHYGKELAELGASGYRISFVQETEEEMAQVLSQYERMFACGISAPIRKKAATGYTNGHFKRGVE